MKSILSIPKKNGTVHLSCRIEKDVFDILSKDADEKGISLNSLVNSMAKKFISWDIHSSDIHLVPLTKEVLGKLFDKLDDQSLQQIAKNIGGFVTKELVFLSLDEMNFDNLLKAILLSASRFGTVKHKIVDSKHVICIHHGICINFSKFLSHTHIALANELSLSLNITNITYDMISMEIDETELKQENIVT